MKYTVFFVEDEETIREKIRNCIDWPSTDFEYLGDAEDGERALMKIYELRPDIVVTDIRMPKLNGLELCREIQYESPDTCILILSGYSDFEYAREAISLNVFEYLLKPITPMNLLKALNKAALHISSRKISKREIDSLRSELLANRSLQIERCFQNLMSGKDVVEILKKTDALGVNLRAGCYQVMVIRSHEYLDIAQLQAIVRETGYPLPVFRIGNKEAGVLFLAQNAERLQAQVNLISSRVHHGYGRFDKTLELVCGTLVRQLRDVCLSYHAACIKADIEKKSGYVDDKRIAEELSFLQNLDGLDTAMLSEYLKTGLASELNDFLDRYLVSFKKNKGVVIYSLYTISHLTFVVKDFMEQYGISMDALPKHEHTLSAYETGAAVESECRKILSAVLSARDAQRASQYDGIVDEVCRKIRKDYAAGDISLNALARAVNTSPAYLSTIFKQHMGKTITAYIVDIRISKAKELLRTTCMRTSEIGEAVGYGDPNYFSVFFKKHTGMTPREYQNEK